MDSARAAQYFFMMLLVSPYWLFKREHSNFCFREFVIGFLVKNFVKNKKKSIFAH